MQLATQIAQQFREVTLDGKWIALTNIKEQIEDLSWEQATTSIHGLNSIALLCFHINYYIAGVNQVMEGGSLDIRDKFSFDMPPITSAEEWDRLRQKFYADADRFAELVEQLNEETIRGPFVEEKYGSYYRNLTGMIEHAYYHFGQMVLIKKLVLC